MEQSEGGGPGGAGEAMRTEMTFTNDELKRLKERMLGYVPLQLYSMSVNELAALIARLEAAEKVIWKNIALDDSIAFGSSSDLMTHNQIVDETRAAMEAWRKVAGK